MCSSTNLLSSLMGLEWVKDQGNPSGPASSGKPHTSTFPSPFRVRLTWITKHCHRALSFWGTSKPAPAAPLDGVVLNHLVQGLVQKPSSQSLCRGGGLESFCSLFGIPTSQGIKGGSGSGCGNQLPSFPASLAPASRKIPRDTSIERSCTHGVANPKGSTNPPKKTHKGSNNPKGPKTPNGSKNPDG